MARRDTIWHAGSAHYISVAAVHAWVISPTPKGVVGGVDWVWKGLCGAFSRRLQGGIIRLSNVH